MSENMWNDVSKAEVERLRAELAQVDEIGRLRAELDALKASNAELRASADEAQAARLQAEAGRDAARTALEPFADVANQYPRIVDHAAIGVVSGGEAAMPFVTTGPHTMAAYRAAADALKGEA